MGRMLNTVTTLVYWQKQGLFMKHRAEILIKVVCSLANVLGVFIDAFTVCWSLVSTRLLDL